MEKQTFPEWLQGRLDDKGWTQADLCRASKGAIKSGTLADLMTGRRELGRKMGQAIAEALDVPPWLVFEAAGYWTKSGSDKLEQEREILRHRISQLKDKDEIEQTKRVLDAILPPKKSGGVKRREGTI